MTGLLPHRQALPCDATDVARPGATLPSASPDARPSCVGAMGPGHTYGGTKAERESIADLIARMVAQGSVESEIAKAVGVNKRTVRRHRAKLRGLERAKAGRSPTSKTSFGIAIPAWCPLWLREDYHRLGRLYGEEIAARDCRRLKREAEACAAGIV